MDFDQRSITDFFEKTSQHHDARHSYMQNFPMSGYALVGKIPKWACILDVGCGQNLFKPYFANLIGIDVIGSQCDIKTSLIDFKPEQTFDVVLCLGSVFGSLDDIRCQVAHIKTMLNREAKIYWRNHPARPEFQPPGVTYPPFFYPWTEQTHSQLCDEFGFTLDTVAKEYIKVQDQVTDIYRIYAQWTLKK
jgi:hypothetical protein